MGLQDIRDQLWYYRVRVMAHVVEWRARLTRYPRYLIELFVKTSAERYAKLQFYWTRSERSCDHKEIKVLNAEQYKTPYGYSYWIAHLKCRDCPEEWKVQARTPGLYSSDPRAEYYLDSSR